MKISITVPRQYPYFRKKTLFKVVTHLVCLGILTGGATYVNAGAKTCGSFFLRNSIGEIINPLTGENADQPLSSRKTYGACHDYQLITKGFHFQQGWEKVSVIPLTRKILGSCLMV